MIRIAINGYGRIGRVAHRVILERFLDRIQVAAINAGSSTDITGWMYLLKYDTAYGPLDTSRFKLQALSIPESEKTEYLKDCIGYLLINSEKIPVFSQKDPSLLPWKDLAIDVVIESTGVFTTEEKMRLHLNSGAKAVVLSAPIKDGGSVPTYVISVNEKDYKNEPLISNASCTTNCITPVAKVVLDNFGIEKAMMTTVHGYTSDQRLQDGGHKDYRRARAAAENIVPTTTGATIAAAEALPALSGIFTGLAIRVPVPVGSLSDFTFLVKKNTTVEEVNKVFEEAAQKEEYKGILATTRDPLVSSDIVGSPYSCIVDLSLTQVVGGNMIKVVAWYDNEYGYANRLVEEVVLVGERVSNSASSTP
jgi:glyceraldehyde 3-phosphate dehydrogenase